MADDVLLNKAAAIERAVQRVREEHAGDDRHLLDNQTRQDAIILNLQRACESSIDAAMHLVRRRIVTEHLDDFLAFSRLLLRF
jgi:uncharacterized protein YutE (UPF0331/DUF86 family)